MAKRFERLHANIEAVSIGAVLVVLAVAYLVSRFMGGS